MKRCAFLSMDSLDGYFAYDTMLFEPLKAVGWQAEEVSWHQTNVDWQQFDAVIIRTTWDYQQDAAKFLHCLETIEASGAKLFNSLNIVRWNINKGYLQDLQNQGVSIIPSQWFEVFSLHELSAAFVHFNTTEIVIKPLISANADFTYRLTREQLTQKADELETVFSNREFLVQPFLSSIVKEGEYSLFYFAGQYSHAILKQPKAGDFRVQEEHGGQLKQVPATSEMLTAASQCLAALPEDVLYARIDLVSYARQFVVMEVELIEPSLYFNMDPESPQRFVDAFLQSV
ncbi:ATP-grasp domain-containing protein [Paraglaciecola aestuariivivens]